ncbi:DNA-binding LacI/PurR family transcriptional regulator [Actinoplanes lutulentus]|uniref:LacI family transcriptional regulator n=1 Tax=Actinoplanes lutulentus TaxID=1287878 RepID=A0A327ZBG6_9ACTN|nr:LacI family DNA-binding transcriptional regulator [Actinoplanes lutulentus]MBB2948858.1 DNA-binding LacI/PurR family transcriptional regulator [Actinoplanes lutulentus]RAK29768.1 LacI family transcriptional regulator [Actinoplanes lutulentus]
MTRPAKRITSEDVARLAGVSRTTVSFVLNNRPGQSIPEETRRRIFDAAKTLQYRPHASARSLAAGRSDIVLLSIPDLPIGSGISRYIEELAAALAENGLTLVTHLEGAHGRPVADVCATVAASAVIGLLPFTREAAAALHSAGAVAVLPPHAGEDLEIMEPVGHAQATHLIDRGHTQLGYALPAHTALKPMGDERLRGANSACAAAGLPAPLALSTSLEIADAAAAVRQWLDQGVTGVCAFNDDTAIAVLAGLREHGLSAPGDLAVVGADDIPTARLASPPLSTVAFDLHQAGARQAAAVVAALAGQDHDLGTTEGSLRVIQRASS